MKILLFFFVYFVSCYAHAAFKEQTVHLDTETGHLVGSLLYDQAATNAPLALLIAGSGPTDRNGNNPSMHNNSLKMLAQALAQAGIASLRYDKRGVAESKEAGLAETDLRFNQYVNDAAAWLNLARQEYGFKHLVVIGHSEGSLIGMLVSQQAEVSQFISIAGAGQRIDKILLRQLATQPAVVVKQTSTILEQLLKGASVADVPPYLNALFRPSVQPYMISWLKYDPQLEIAKLKQPVLIIQGTTDLQVTVEDAELLAQANPKAIKQIIPEMNHVLKTTPLEGEQNIQSYNQPDLPINSELVQAITTFIKQ
ncbi:alpha/beta hydrolase [Motilimonas eburnea]|uniref:alpha/beta hydrolase n=1 Tax=Motilimonas eburnea TaxID=1737488 RepID=UPI001E4E7CE4|nr:alpha/beta fold hydrolase [Motilimonas eburnea]MCE2572394.1 lysophospholipase [Motilimonas eburnea]